MGYIDPNISENDRKLQKHEKRNIPFLSLSLSSLNVLFFPLFTQLSVYSLLPWLPFFIFRFIGIFRSFEILANISYFWGMKMPLVLQGICLLGEPVNNSELL